MPSPYSLTDAQMARYNAFMRLKATGHQIYMALPRRGVNWSGSSKSSMARAYAVADTFNSVNSGVAIREEDFQALTTKFGVRP